MDEKRGNCFVFIKAGSWWKMAKSLLLFFSLPKCLHGMQRSHICFWVISVPQSLDWTWESAGLFAIWILQDPVWEVKQGCEGKIVKSHTARQAMCVNINSSMGSTMCNMKQDESEVKLYSHHLPASYLTPLSLRLHIHKTGQIIIFLFIRCCNG